MTGTAVIVDDSATFRSVATAILVEAGYAVIGEAADGPAAVETVRSLRPDLVLLDIRLPGRSGFAVADDLAAEAAPPTVILTSSADYRREAALAPARAFIPKVDLTPQAIRLAVGRG